ncbi:MAG TPA: hypothetical protein ENK62_07890 [Chromatiales bacterium]|nr:hypothetical protein [Chromatiales bacterium]
MHRHAALQTVEALQDFLQGLYGIDPGHRVGDFLVTDRALARALDPGDARDTPEKLLLREDGETLELSLYLDPALLAALPPAADPVLRPEQVDGFCKVLEGVSHFLYAVWRGVRDRSFSRLEMELQAEVDKYATLATLIRQTHGRRPESWLRAGLFERIRLAPGLSEAERLRYHTANRYAARYCGRLEREYSWRWISRATRDELRRFYRLTHHSKLRHIGSG